MHRKNSLSVKVKAPARGLVTRWPPSTADLRNPQDYQRVCSVAENVRFEDGVIANSPGYERVAITGLSLLTGLVSHWRFEEAGGIGSTRYDAYGPNHLPYLTGSTGDRTSLGKIGNAIISRGDAFYTTAPVGLSPAASSFTIVGWVKNVDAAPATDAQDWPVARIESAYELKISGTSLVFTVTKAAGGTDTVSTAITMTAGTWYFVAAWRDTGSNTIKVRVNGAAAVSAASSGALAAGSGIFSTAGGVGVTVIDNLSHAVDSLSYYNRALSSGDLDALYNSGAAFDFPFFTGGAFRFLYQGNVLLRSPTNPFYMGNTERLFLGGRSFSADPRQYVLSAAEVYPGASGSTIAAATSEFRWRATDFLDKVVFVQNSIAPQYHISGDARIIPGLPVGNKYDGCECFFDHLLLWKDQTLKWSETADLTTWIPVANTISDLRLTLTNATKQPATGANLIENATSDPWLAVNENPAGLTVGQYVRIDDTQGGLPYYNFYLVGAVAPAAGVTGTLIATDQTIVGSATTQIFLTTHAEWAAGQRVVVAGNTAILTVSAVDTNTLTFFTIDDSVVAISPRNGTVSVTIKIDSQNTGLQVGEYVSLGSSLTAGVDIFKITAVTTAGTGTNVTLADQWLGSNRNVLSYPRGTYIVRQPWVKLTKSTAGNFTALASTSITERYAVQLLLQNLTGRTATNAVMLAGNVIATLNANETGETVVVGAEDNGPIWQVIAMGEYAHIFKNRSIQSIQYVGRASGTFFLRAEIKNEGLIARNSVVKLNDSRVVLLGNRELYDYQGGLTINPVCTQYTRQLFQELDRTRLSDIVLHHREQRNEIWVVYPITGGSKVLIWNYLEDTATIDTYDPILGMITSATLVDWINDPTWLSLAETLTWENVDPTLTWDSFIGSGSERASVFATSPGELWVHGNVYSRNGLAYTCFAETMDYDFGDESAFKYVDSVQVGLQVKAPEEKARYMYVQVGYRNNLDAAITWTALQQLKVNGDGQAMTKVNPGGAGRYLRVRFISTDAGVQWRVASYNFCVRAGGTY